VKKFESKFRAVTPAVVDYPNLIIFLAINDAIKQVKRRVEEEGVARPAASDAGKCRRDAIVDKRACMHACIHLHIHINTCTYTRIVSVGPGGKRRRAMARRGRRRRTSPSPFFFSHSSSPSLCESCPRG